MRFVKLDKGEFLGLDATIESASASSLPWVCAYLQIEADGIYDGVGGEACFMCG